MDRYSPLQIRALVDRYVAAWNEPDPGARRALLDECWAQDGVYCDPSGRATGRDGLCAHIGSFLEERPGTRNELISGVDEHDGYLRFGWQMLGADGTVALEGTDFGEVDSAAGLRRIIGFFGPFPPR